MSQKTREYAHELVSKMTIEEPLHRASHNQTL